MGNPRPRPALLHEKFVAIREYLDVGQQVLAVLLKLPHAGRVSEYECGLREPNLMVVLAYSRFGKVSMESLVDDQVSLDEFRKQLGTVLPKHQAESSQKETETVEPTQVPSEESEIESAIQSKQQRPKRLILIYDDPLSLNPKKRVKA